MHVKLLPSDRGRAGGRLSDHLFVAEELMSPRD